MAPLIKTLKLRVNRFGTYTRNGESHFVLDCYETSSGTFENVRLNIGASECDDAVCEMLSLTRRDFNMTLQYEEQMDFGRPVRRYVSAVPNY